MNQESNLRREKHAAVLVAARKVFLEVGYGVASMDSIAEVAHVSKQTLYNHFGSKKELFASIISSRCEQVIGSALGFEPGRDNNDPRTVFYDLAQRYLDVMFSEEVLALRRTVLAESRRFPELGAIFYHAGPALAAKILAAYLAEQTRRGTLYIECPEIAAEQFLTMLRGNMQLRALLNIEPRPPKEQIRVYIVNAVETLLRAWQR